MNRELLPYRVSHAMISALVGLLLSLGGQPWWLASLMGTVLLAGFPWLRIAGAA